MGPFEPKNSTTPQNKNTYYVQLYTMPLAIYLITVGLGAFIGLQCGVPNPPSKPLFQPDMDMTSTEAHMSLSLTNTSPPPKDLSGLLINNQTNNWDKGLIVIRQIQSPAYRLMLNFQP